MDFFFFFATLIYQVSGISNAINSSKEMDIDLKQWVMAFSYEILALQCGTSKYFDKP